MKNCRLLLSSNLEIRRAELRDRRGTPFSAGAMLTRLWKHLPAVLVAAADLAVQQFDADSPSGRVFHLQPLETGKSWQSCHSMLVLAFRVFFEDDTKCPFPQKGRGFHRLFGLCLFCRIVILRKSQARAGSSLSPLANLSNVCYSRKVVQSSSGASRWQYSLPVEGSGKLVRLGTGESV